MSSQTTICAKRVCANAGRMNELKLEQSTSSNSGVISATNASIPLLTLKNTVANVDHSAPVLQLQSDHHDGAAVNDQVGMITFVSRDNATGAKNLQEYASIVAEIADHTADNEEGKLTFNVTSGAAARAACMTITGGDTDASDSVVTIPGGISVSGRSYTGAAGGTTLWHSYGAGALSTEIAPTYSQITMGGVIQSKILVDLTDLGAKGDAANDVVGLPAGGAAYIAKYLTADMGIIFKAEVAVLEIFGEGTATITNDLDIAFNSSAALAYDGAAGTAEFNTGINGAVLGNSVSVGVGAATPTNNDYIYLVEGDTAASTGVYNAGKLLIILYGHATF